MILIASLNLSPTAYVFDYLSEPARSTKFNFPALICYSLSTPYSEDSMVKQNIECDLEDS